MDKVSVILRSKNEERFIGETIQSIADFIDKPEIILLDNESIDDDNDSITNNTIQILEKEKEVKENDSEYSDISDETDSD